MICRFPDHLLTYTSSGPDKNCYYHEKFLRGKMFLARQIPRVSVKGTGPRRSSSLDSQPNLYAFRFLPGSSASLPGQAHTTVAEERNPAGTTGASPHVSNIAESVASPVASVLSTVQSPLNTLATNRFVELLAYADRSLAPPSLANLAVREIEARLLLASTNNNPFSGLSQPSVSHLILPSYGTQPSTSVPTGWQPTLATSSADDLARAMLLQSIASSQRPQQNEAMQEQILRVQIENDIARMEADAEEDEVRRRIVTMAFLNGTL
jgi:hypothetical protein